MTGDLVRRPTRTVHTLLPVLRWLPSYARADLARDLLAGVGVAALLIPESLGYAGIAGVPPEVGLYAAIAALAAYAVTGGVSILVVGPASPPFPLCAAGCGLGVAPILLALPVSTVAIPVPCDGQLIGAKIAFQGMQRIVSLGQHDFICGPPQYGFRFRTSDTLVVTVH